MSTQDGSPTFLGSYTTLRKNYPELGERLDAFNAAGVALPLSEDQMAHIINMNAALMEAYGNTMGQAVREAIAESMGLK